MRVILLRLIIQVNKLWFFADTEPKVEKAGLKMGPCKVVGISDYIQVHVYTTSTA